MLCQPKLAPRSVSVCPFSLTSCVPSTLRWPLTATGEFFGAEKAHSVLITNMAGKLFLNIFITNGLFGHR